MPKNSVITTLQPAQGTAPREIIVLPARGCRRSRNLLAYLQAQGIPFTRIDLESPEGQTLAAQRDLRASPGILVDGVSINPFDLLTQPACRVDEEKVRELLRSGAPTPE
jgi:hypothetical protein